MLICVFKYKGNTGLIGRLVKFGVPFWALICLVFLNAGCTVTKSKPAGPDTKVVEQAHKRFVNQEYDSAEKQFSMLARQGDSEKLIKTGRYGLSCIALARAQDMGSFIKALEPLLLQFDESDPVHRENSALLIHALNHGYQVLSKEKKGIMEQMNVQEAVKLNQKKENEKLKKMIKTLEHQISTLESIDQEIQEKRKNQ